MPGGRPTSYNKEIADEILLRLSKGEALIKICQDEHLPDDNTIYNWLLDQDRETKYPGFFDKYRIAREIQLERRAEQIRDLAMDSSRDQVLPNGNGGYNANMMAIKRDELIIKTDMWLMSKLAPKKYGDKITNEIKGEDGGPAILQIVTKAPEKK